MLRFHTDIHSIRRDIAAAALEFLGTLFLLLGLGGIQAAMYADLGRTVNRNVVSVESLLYIAVSMGLAFLVTGWLFYRVTDGLFNPAVSTAFFVLGVIGPVRWALFCLAQLIGGIVASALLLALLPGPLDVNTAPGPGVNRAQALFIEMFITATLCLAVLMLADQKQDKSAFAPIGIGLTLFVCELWAVPFTGGAMNTARAFGPAVVTHFENSHWIYWVGPLLGSLLAAAVYRAIEPVYFWVLKPEQLENVREGRAPDPTQAEGVAAFTPRVGKTSDGGGGGSGRNPSERRSGMNPGDSPA
ncbi:aquaporin-like protein, partial [Gautieria morchelliformis]